jgi:cobalamin biosynthesis protein CobD/CbiB
MRELSRTLGLVFSLVFLLAGAYLVYGSTVSLTTDGFVTLIAGSVLCAFAILLAVSSIKTHLSLRALIRHTKHVHEPRASGELPKVS